MIHVENVFEEMSVQEETVLPEPLRPLEEIAWNYWWSWTPGGTALFRDLDPFVWEECEHNPRRWRPTLIT